MNLDVLEVALELGSNNFDISQLYTSFYIQEEINKPPSMFIILQNTNNLLARFNIQGGEKINISLKDAQKNYMHTSWVINDIRTEYSDSNVDARFKHEGNLLLECVPEYVFKNQFINKIYYKLDDELYSVGIKEILNKYFFISNSEIDIEEDIDKDTFYSVHSPNKLLDIFVDSAESSTHTPYFILFRNKVSSSDKKVVCKSFRRLYEDNSQPDKLRIMSFTNNNVNKMIEINNYKNTLICTSSYIPKILKIKSRLDMDIIYKRKSAINIDTGKMKFLELGQPEVLNKSKLSLKAYEGNLPNNIEFKIKNNNSEIDLSDDTISEYIKSQIETNKVVLNVVSKLSVHIGDIVKISNVNNIKDRYLLKDFMISKVKHIKTRHEEITEIEMFGIDISLSNFSSLSDTLGEVE